MSYAYVLDFCVLRVRDSVRLNPSRLVCIVLHVASPLAKQIDLGCQGYTPCRMQMTANRDSKGNLQEGLVLLWSCRRQMQKFVRNVPLTPVKILSCSDLSGL